MLLTHILKTKPIWLEPAKTVSGGTLYPISSYSTENEEVSTSSISFDLAGNLQSAQFGSFTLKEIKVGDSKILDAMPDWPSLPQEKKDKFDFQLFMEILGKTTKIFQ